MSAVIAEQLLTVPEVCALLRVSRMTLNRWARNGTLEPLHVGRGVRYELTAIVDFIHGDRPDADMDDIVAGALALLEEQRAEDERPLCPACGRRRVNRGRSVCTQCEEAAERQRAHKMKWWVEKGDAQRRQRRLETGK
jgi:excisionase family DNA binding protein